jgi:phage terminase small subunit
VKAALAARQVAFQAELGVAKQDIVNGLLSAIQMGREQQNPAAMIAGFVQVAKLCGFYEPEVHKVDMAIDTASLRAKFAAMSDEELLSVINSSQATA